MGTPQLHRTRRSVELLPAGKVFLERTNLILEEVEKAAADARRTGAGEFGRLSVGFVHSSTYGLLPSILERFHRLYPDIELDLHEMTIPEQHAGLMQGTIDIGLLRPQPAPAELEIETKMEDPFFVAVPHTHFLAMRKSVALKSLADEPMVMLPHRGYTLFHSRTIAMCAKAGFAPEIVHRACQIHTVVGLAGAGMGVAIVPGTTRNLQPDNVRSSKFSTVPRQSMWQSRGTKKRKTCLRSALFGESHWKWGENWKTSVDSSAPSTCWHAIFLTQPASMPAARRAAH
ncbi:MAG TPA: LysR substrate-binding domain-containing protein [Ramlibacter sp.]|nr:LysR substrate-binding domain-containing protein [Ramlibacter sp.]